MWESLGIAALYGVLGIVLSFVGYKAFDLAETRIDFAAEIKKGNIAAAIVIAGFLIGVCFIIGRAVGRCRSERGSGEAGPRSKQERARRTGPRLLDSATNGTRCWRRGAESGGAGGAARHAHADQRVVLVTGARPG